MATRDIAIACQGGGSHAAFTGGVLPVLLREFDNLALAHTGRSAAYHESGLDTRADTPVLVAISGTSGGAISALLGWYGFITGGADEAQQRLDAFWDSNSATHAVEAVLNHQARALSDMAALFGWDIKASPYMMPMRGLEVFNTTVWPQIARYVGVDNAWMSPDYFSLPRLLHPRVDWPLIQAWGDFASIPLEIQRWVHSDLEAAMFPPDAPRRQGCLDRRARIEANIAAKLDAAARVLARLDQLGVGDKALLRVAFGRWKMPQGRLQCDHASLAALAKAVQAVTLCIPHLLIGAVELHEGDFVAFSSERATHDGGMSLEAVLASASVPWLFRACEMGGTDPDTLARRRLALWDGLFSQNPPIKDFLAGVLNEDKKPDEIWVVQINPLSAKVEKGAGTHAAERLVMSGGEIWDLRNALAGNLSLNQEIGFVEAINRRAAAAPEARAGDRLVQVDRIVMDGDAIEAATGMDLGANSKLDRDPRLKDALCEHGRVQARRYLALRDRIGRLCGGLGTTLADAAGGDHAGAYPSTVERGALVIDGTTLYRTGTAAVRSPRALVRWHSVDAELGGHPVRVEGRSELADDGDGDAAWRVKAVGITAVSPQGDGERKGVTVQRAAQAAQAARPDGDGVRGAR